MLLAGFCRTAAAAKLPPRYGVWRCHTYAFEQISLFKDRFFEYKNGAFRLRFYIFKRFYNLALSDVDIKSITEINTKSTFLIYNFPSSTFRVIGIIPAKVVFFQRNIIVFPSS